ncbi:ATPase WRNIP1-like isoform X2 [Phymastichus coffea]|uniref:ATPase WRNIP1-like isoform X2 n=1 Tax=Phymastichus coffea TaxID=108790 RepID=UPI00273BDCD3|nr:ATPase WRNIP1-like isoform X2 [Phymastichus coffea]
MSDKPEEAAKLIECPICSKEFSTSSIENHVSKCLFLNESSNASQSATKRSPSLKSSPVAKKLKVQTESHNIFKTITKQGSTLKPESSEPKVLESTLNNTQNFRNDQENKIDQKDFIPLAEKMRPTSLLSYIGQRHILGPESMLYQLLTRNEIPNIILWGPPGCGKTSLANVIANVCKHSPKSMHRFIKLSATTSGINEVKEAITIASNELKFKRYTVMFIDEIHRFNKIQQDTFLPHVEAGTITLIGATTENPSYSLNAALLSRCKVIVLNKLSIENLEDILINAVKSLDGSLSEMRHRNITSIDDTQVQKKFLIDKSTITWLAETSDGDARIALGDDIKDSLKKTHMLYDKKGDQHYDLISALHKSIRASNDNAALYWLARMLSGGEDPVYIARRLVRASSEDIGLADPKALNMAVNTMRACKELKSASCHVLLAQLAIYLARAPKSREMDDSINAAKSFVASYKDKQPPVPINLRMPPNQTKPGNEIGENLTYWPNGILGVDFC